MKKAQLTLKKNTATRDANKSQRKIFTFFSKSQKSKDVEFQDTTKRKRKMTGDSSLEEIRLKATKLDDITLNSYEYTATKTHSKISDSLKISNKDNIVKDLEASTKENTLTAMRLYDCKENIGTPKPSIKNTLTQKDCIVNKTEEAEKLIGDQSSLTNLMDEYNEYFEEDWSADMEINLNSLQRCKIVDVTKEKNVTTLIVEHEDFPCATTVICSGYWKDACLKKNDFVVIQAKKEAEYWIVDNNNGFLVVQPDILISGTTVVGALFCPRKSVLAEKFKKIETLPYQQGDSTAMVIGCLVHELLQKTIRENIHELSDVTKLMNTILQSKDTMSVLYYSEISFDECHQQMEKFVAKIFEFVQHYIKGKKQKQIESMKHNFKGRIIDIRDIEENIWIPKLGIKGKVDVTVEVSINSRQRIMPLELKTGRPSFSLEHKGQLILYMMMMALTGQEVDAGLLLYLKDNNMQEIQCGHSEKRDLILLRNTLAVYFSSTLDEKLINSDTDLKQQIMELPHPINHHNACTKCSFNSLCCTYLSKDKELDLPESHPLMKMSKIILEKLKPAHIDYIIKWITLLQMEEVAQPTDYVLKDMWTLAPEKRELKGTCISNLKVIGKVIEKNSKYEHQFARAYGDKKIEMKFSENEYVLVSTDTRLNISAGFIVNAIEDSVFVLLDRNVTTYNAFNTSFHIDKYASNSLHSFNFANVGGLLDDNEICTRLRNIVIDKEPAKFVKSLPPSIIASSIKILADLNKSQQRAVLQAMAAENYVLIKGMPGTGKTQTLVALVKLLHKTGFSVLITAHTHNALDNLLLKLMDDDIDFLRLGSISSIHPALKHKTEGYVTADCHSPESFDAVYSSKNIIGVTCFGAYHALLGKRTFDVCIVDESAQAMQSIVLRPLFNSRKFVLAGDPDQLAPIIKSKTARKLGADESLFTRLDSVNNTVNLTRQYRMNKGIMRVANKLTYQDQLKPGNTTIENATYNSLYAENLIKQEKWLQQVLSQDIDQSVIMLNTGCTYDLKVNQKLLDKYPQTDQIYSNIWEAAVISRLLDTLLQMGVDPKNIGVIAPYRAHVALLKKISPEEVEVSTVDQYQGRDKEIILYSCTRSLVKDQGVNEKYEVLGDHRRLTVAVTRAKHKLIVVADKDTLSQYTPFKKLFLLIEDKNVVNLIHGSDDFSWETIGSSL